MLSGGTDGTVRAWDPLTGAAAGPTMTRCGRPLEMVPVGAPDGRTVLCIGTASGSILWRDLATGEPWSQKWSTGWAADTTPVCPLLLTVSTTRHRPVIAACVDRQRILRWTLDGARLDDLTVDDTARVTGLVSIDGVLLVADDAGAVHHIDAETGTPTREPSFPHTADADRVHAVRTATGGCRLLVVRGPRSRIVDGDSGRPVERSWSSSPNAVTTMTTPDARTWFVTATAVGIARQDADTGATAPFINTERPIADIVTAGRPDGQAVIINVELHGDLQFRDATTANLVASPIRENTLSLALLDDGTALPIVVCADGNGTVRYRDALTADDRGNPFQVGESGITQVRAVPVPGGGHLLVATNLDDMLLRWTFPGDTQLPPVQLNGKAVLLHADIDASGIPVAYLRFRHEDRAVERWRLDTGQPADTLPNSVRAIYDHNGATTMILADPDGSLHALATPPLTSP